MTKFAVLSDIHGNVWALESVIADAQKRNAKQIINLGDCLYSPLAPKATYDLLRSLQWTSREGGSAANRLERLGPGTANGQSYVSLINNRHSTPDTADHENRQ